MDQLSHTAFPEQLLATEVAATEQRRLSGRLRFAALPVPWRLEDFDFEACLRSTASWSRTWAPCASSRRRPT